MKKVILFALMCVCALSARAIENAKCYLQHGENVTTYDASAIATAIEDAVKGDVLYLGEGVFPGFTLSKDITVRGAGYEKTQINSNIIIAIPGSPIITNTLLYGLGCNSYIQLSNAMTGVTIEKCSFNSFYAIANNSNISITHCSINSYFQLSSTIKSITITNSYIYEVEASSGSNSSPSYYYYTTDNVSTFINCNIRKTYNGSSLLKGSFINCIIKESLQNTTYNKCVFVNTLWGSDIEMGTNSTQQETYVDKNFTLDKTGCSYDAEALSTKGYLGNDGTVVGIEGGTNPFSLDLNLPRITASKLQLDRENKVLNVNLKVTSK